MLSLLRLRCDDRYLRTVLQSEAHIPLVVAPNNLGLWRYILARKIEYKNPWRSMVRIVRQAKAAGYAGDDSLFTLDPALV